MLWWNKFGIHGMFLIDFSFYIGYVKLMQIFVLVNMLLKVIGKKIAMDSCVEVQNIILHYETYFD